MTSLELTVEGKEGCHTDQALSVDGTTIHKDIQIVDTRNVSPTTESRQIGEPESANDLQLQESNKESDKESDKEILESYENLFRNRFTELDEHYCQKTQIDEIPLVENFSPPRRPQKRQYDYHRDNHRDNHRYHKRRYDDRSSSGDRRGGGGGGGGGHHMNYQEERNQWQKQDHYYGHRQYEHSSHNESRSRRY